MPAQKGFVRIDQVAMFPAQMELIRSIFMSVEHKRGSRSST
jgi:hypothetical protein